MKKSFCFLAAFVFAFSLVLGLGDSALAHNKHSKGIDDNCFTGIYAFGDSLTDTGNLFALTGQPTEPYFEGRISNGIVWVEYLARSLRLDESAVNNFAYAGATTGRDNFNDIPGFIEFPGLQDQLDFFELSLQGGSADPDALYVIWAGSNDFFINGGTPETVATAITNIVQAVQRLHFAGAKHIMVFNMPDLGRTPFGLSTDPVGLSLLTTIFNSELANALDTIGSLGLETIQFDVVAVLDNIAANPKRFRFLNITDSYLESGEGDPNRYLYWDSVHPTTRGHQVIANSALRVLLKYKLKLFIQSLL